MKQKHIVNRLSSVLCSLSSVVGPLHLSRTLYKSTLFIQNKPNFQKSQINSSAYIKMTYKNKTAFGLVQNKPNQTQFKAKTKPICQKSKMNVNIYYTIDYNNKTAFRRIKNKPNSNPIQTQTNPISRHSVRKEAYGHE